MRPTASEGSSRNNLFNNTVCMPSGGDYAVKIPSASYSGGPTDPVSNIIKNNILYDASGHGSIATYSSSPSGFQSDYNVVISGFSIDDGDTSVSLSTWRGYGYDTHSVLVTDPTTLFVNYSGNDFHLKAGSPAINAGTTVSGVSDDKDGNTRPQGGAYDIGCYEAVGGSPLSITTASLPADTVGVAYSQTLAATGGTTPYTWAHQRRQPARGALSAPRGGVISGTPTTAGTASFTVKVTDNVAATASKALSIVVNAAAIHHYLEPSRRHGRHSV